VNRTLFLSLPASEDWRPKADRRFAPTRNGELNEPVHYRPGWLHLHGNDARNSTDPPYSTASMPGWSLQR
jgi:hypothetical protein